MIQLDEYEAVYRMMDENSDLVVGEEEVQNWVNDNLHTICKPYREKLIFDL